MTNVTQELIKRAVPKIIDPAIDCIKNFLQTFLDDVLIRYISSTDNDIKK